MENIEWQANKYITNKTRHSNIIQTSLPSIFGEVNKNLNYDLDKIRAQCTAVQVDIQEGQFAHDIRRHW